MKSVIFGLSLASAAAAQVVNGGVSMLPALTPSQEASSAAPTQASSTEAASSEITSAPSSSSTDFYQVMPYSSYMAGGYQSLDCGYGYQKSSDGYCTAMSWVCLTRLISQFSFTYSEITV